MAKTEKNQHQVSCLLVLWLCEFKEKKINEKEYGLNANFLFWTKGGNLMRV